MAKRHGFLEPAADPWKDPQPYDGPIQRLDGRRPYNHYLWPMEGDHFDGHEVDRQCPWGFRISVVALWNGKWSTSGTVESIETNRDCYDRPCVFDTREAALRSSVASFVRRVRNARAWKGHDRLSEERAARLIAWAMGKVGRQAPTLRALPPPSPPPTGLPLLDFGRAVA